MKKLLLSLSFFILPLCAALAQELVVTVDSIGQFGTRLPDSLRFSMSELKITGPMGGADLKILQNMLKNPRQKKGVDKVLTVLDLQQVEGYCTVMKMEMKNVQSGHSTQITVTGPKYDIKVDKSLFTVAKLEKGL